MSVTIVTEKDIRAELITRIRETQRLVAGLRETLSVALALLAEKDRPARAYRIKPLSLGGAAPGIDLDRSLRLADALDDEAQARKLELRK